MVTSLSLIQTGESTGNETIGNSLIVAVTIVLLLSHPSVFCVA